MERQIAGRRISKRICGRLTRDGQGQGRMAVTTRARATVGHPGNGPRKVQPDAMWRRGRSIRLMSGPLAALMAILACALAGATPASAQNVFTIAKYPVGAGARNAVAAKRVALREGRVRAFRSLLKRLVPVTDYRAIPTLPGDRVEGFVSGFTVNNEQNSGTEYYADLTFRFDDRAVRAFARDANLRIVDQQASPLVVVPLWSPAFFEERSRQVTGSGGGWSTTATAGVPAPLTPGAEAAPGAMQRSWSRAWEQLDLANALTPVRLRALRSGIAPSVLQQAYRADRGALAVIANEYRASGLMFAIMGPAPSPLFVRFALIGLDAQGPFLLERQLPRIEGDDRLTFEAAAVVGLGILEGRWKAAKAPRRYASAPAGDGMSADSNPAAALADARPVSFTLRISSLREWREMQDYLRDLPGARDIKVEGVLGRERDVSLVLPGGAQALQAALGQRGYALNDENGRLVAQR